MIQAGERYPNTEMAVVDSKNAAVGEGLIVSAAVSAAASGKNLNEVAQTAKRVSEKVRLAGIMDTVRHVYRTGRIPKIAARFGSILNIKPVFTIRNGAVHINGITQNKENGLNRVLHLMEEKVKDRPIHVAIAHADAIEEGERFNKKLKSIFMR
jgi:DegV family protein with EDD domain